MKLYIYVRTLNTQRKYFRRKADVLTVTLREAVYSQTFHSLLSLQHTASSHTSELSPLLCWDLYQVDISSPNLCLLLMEEGGRASLINFILPRMTVGIHQYARFL